MARHRNVRSLKYADEYEYDDVYGHSLEEEGCLSPGESAQWMYDRAKPSLASFYEEPEDEADAPEAGPGAVDVARLSLDDMQQAKLMSCLDEIRDVLGDSVPEEIVVKTVLAHDFNAQTALDELLNSSNDKPTSSKSACELKPKFPTIDATKKTSAPEPPVKIVAPPISVKLIHAKGFKVDDDREFQISRTRTPSPDTRKLPCKSPEPPHLFDDKSIVRHKENKVDPVVLYRAERGSTKDHLYIVVIGHVDAGKSTLMGRLLCDLGEVSQRVLHKYEQESKKVGKQSFMYAWVLDETGEERLRGITMDVGRVQFSTKTKQITVLDAPGHADFIPNMISGAGQADVALLVVDATRGEFETGFDLGGQTREHALLVRSLGINQLAVAVNKLDTTNWSSERFNEICTKLKSFLKQAGFKDSDVTYVPLSGLTGQNLIGPPTDDQLLKWYSGPPLIDVIDNFKPPERPISKPFRMSINDIFKSTGSGFCIFGRIETGVLNCGDKVLVCPLKETATVKSILIDEIPHTVAFAGDQVSVTLLGVDIQNIAVGFILCDPLKPIPIVTVVEARIVVFNIKVPITNGFSVLIHHQSLIESANIIKLKASINKSTGEIIKKKPRCLGNNSVALVDIEISRPVCMEVYKDFKELGRVMLRTGGATIAAGLITAIVK